MSVRSKLSLFISGVGEGVVDIIPLTLVVVAIIVGDSSIVPCRDVVTGMITSPIVSSIDKDSVMKGLEKMTESDDVNILLTDNVTNNVGLPNVELFVREKPVICIGTICVVEISVLS